MAKKTIPVLTASDQPEAKAALPSLRNSVAHVVNVSRETLTENLRDFLRTFDPGAALEMPRESEFYVDELQLTLAVDAKGGIQLVGKLEGGAQAGITVKLKRKQG